MGPSAQNSDFRKYKMADCRHFGFRFWPIISASINIFEPNFHTEMENRQPKGTQCSEIRFSKIQDGGRPPSWISIFAYNFGVDQHFCTKFCIKMESGQPKGSKCSKIRFSKIQDGGRRHLGFRFSPIILASIDIFSAKFGTVMENRQSEGSQCSKIRLFLNC